MLGEEVGEANRVEPGGLGERRGCARLGVRAVDAGAVQPPGRPAAAQRRPAAGHERRCWGSARTGRAAGRAAGQLQGARRHGGVLGGRRQRWRREQAVHRHDHGRDGNAEDAGHAQGVGGSEPRLESTRRDATGQTAAHSSSFTPGTTTLGARSTPGRRPGSAPGRTTDRGPIRTVRHMYETQRTWGPITLALTIVGAIVVGGILLSAALWVLGLVAGIFFFLLRLALLVGLAALVVWGIR